MKLLDRKKLGHQRETRSSRGKLREWRFVGLRKLEARKSRVEVINGGVVEPLGK